MDLSNLEKILEGEPKYRLKQAKSAVFQNLIEDWAEAPMLPLRIRERLKSECPLFIRAEIFPSKTGDVIKVRMAVKGGFKVESVLMRHKNKRNTVCVSSQVGCPLGCRFCATGKIGFKKNLDAFEIVEQILFFARYLKKKGKRVTNIVFMGMGEPLLNYQNVIGTIKILNDKEGFNLGARHFSVSTVGIVEGIEKLAREKLQINLAISLHAPNDKLRSKLMPINKKYPIKKILNAADNYIKKTRRRVMFEYVMINNLNDSEEHAKALAKLMKKPLYFVNLISYNALHFKVLPTSSGQRPTSSSRRPSESRHDSYNSTGIFKPSLSSRIKKFKEILEKEGVMVTQRYRFGKDIEAACGQLAVKK